MESRNKIMWRVREMLANNCMVAMIDDTRGLIDKYGYDGAEDYFKYRLQLLRDLRDADKAVGDDDDVF